MPRTYGPESFEALMSLIVDRVMAEPIDQREESEGSREESKAANNDKQLTIEADNSEMQFINSLLYKNFSPKWMKPMLECSSL